MTRAKSPTFRVPFRRRREGNTDFSKRLALVKSGKTRMVVRRSNRDVRIQFVDFSPEGDKTILTVTGRHLEKKYKWPSKRNVWTAYLAGLLAGSEAKSKGVKSFVLDIGRYSASKGSLLFAALKGAVDAGLEGALDEGKVPMDKLDNPPDAYKEKFGKIRGSLSG